MKEEGREGMEGREGKVQAVLDALAQLRKRANANTVFGEAMTSEGRTVIPVARVTYGFSIGVQCEAEATAGAEAGAATQTMEEAGGESGEGIGGMVAHPLAVIEVTAEGTRIEPITNVNRPTAAMAGLLLIGWTIFWLARALIKIFGRQG